MNIDQIIGDLVAYRSLLDDAILSLERIVSRKAAPLASEDRDRLARLTRPRPPRRKRANVIPEKVLGAGSEF